MTPRERLFARLEGKTVDRLPNLNILMYFSAFNNNVTYKKYVTDYKTLVESDIRMSEEFGIDLLCAISDPVREAEGLGCKITLPENDVPYVSGHIISDISEVNKIKVIRSEDCGRMYDRIMAVSYFKEKAGGKYPVCGWVEGAFAEACDVRGINDFMADLLAEDDTGFIKELLEKTLEQNTEFALSQIKAGADIIGIGDAASSLISVDMYEEFALPYQIRIIEKIHAAGAKVKLHICGNITRHFPMIALTKADIVDIDWMNDFSKAVEIFEPYGIAANGNYDPVAVLLQGSTDTVECAVKKCVSAAGKFGTVSAGCEVPKFTPKENLLTVYRTLSGKCLT